MEPDFQALRREFPILERKTYLNRRLLRRLANGVKAPSKRTRDRLLVGANGMRGSPRMESVRAVDGNALARRPDEIAVTASVSAGPSPRWRAAVELLRSAQQSGHQRFRVSDQCADLACPGTARRQVVHVRPAADGYIPLEISPRRSTRRRCSWRSLTFAIGTAPSSTFPGIVGLAHAKGARVLLDCYQSVGSLDIDVKALDVDFAAGGMLKYLLGTAGIGFLYVRDSLIQSLLPANSGWFAQADIAAMDITANRPAPNARRFEAGAPAVANCYAAEAGLKFLLAVGTPAIEIRNYALTRRCMLRLEEIGWRSITPTQNERRGATVAVPSRDCGGCPRTDEAGIVTSYRDGNVRAKFSFLQ